VSCFKVALIGYGLAGAAFHAPLIAATSGLRLAAIVTSDVGRGARARLEHPDAVLLARADEIWARSGDYDLVVVAAPNRAHVRLALAALDAGLHVVVDKPFAPTAEEARLVVERARKLGLMVTVFQNRRWDGDFLTVRELLEQDAFGQVHRFESRYERWRPEVRGGWRERPAAEEAGGRLFDLGSHLVDQALLLFGPVDDLYSEVECRRPGAQVDDDVFLALRHTSGVHSHLWMSALAAQPGPRFRVLGERAAFVKHGMDVQEEALRAGRKPDEPNWGEEPEDRWGLLGAGDELRKVRTRPGSYGAFYAGVSRSLRDGTPPPVDPEDAIRVLELLEAARDRVPLS
jgi:scyllo-inositol 2-dehydrogenase (NADP+)